MLCNALFPISKVQFSLFNGMLAYEIAQNSRQDSSSVPRKHSF